MVTTTALRVAARAPKTIDVGPAELDAGHAAGRAALRSHRPRRGSAAAAHRLRDEDELVVVAALRRRRRPRRRRFSAMTSKSWSVRVGAGGDALDHALLVPSAMIARSSDATRAPLVGLGQRQVSRPTCTPAPSCTDVGRQHGRSTGGADRARGRDGADLGAARGVERRSRIASCLRRGPDSARLRRLDRAVDARDAAGGGQEHAAGHRRRSRGPRRRPSARRPAMLGGLGEQGAARRAVQLGDLGELVGHQGADAGRWPRIASSAGDLRRAGRCSASSSMRENLVSRRSRSSRMYSAWTSERSKIASAARAASASSRGADDLDDLVDVEDRDEQALDQVQALLARRGGRRSAA